MREKGIYVNSTEYIYIDYRDNSEREYMYILQR